MHYKVLIAAALAALVVRAEEPLQRAPAVWVSMPLGGLNHLAGRCELGQDTELADSGQANLSIRCRNDAPSFGGLQQTFPAGAYAGQRVRYSAWLMAAGVEDAGAVTGAGGLWMRVQAPDAELMNRMPERQLSGFTSWVYRDFVVDVPENAEELSIGFWLEGRGQLWVRDLNVETVPASVPANLSWDQPPVMTPRLSLE